MNDDKLALSDQLTFGIICEMKWNGVPPRQRRRLCYSLVARDGNM